ncbi:MAG: hypothetical protein KC423_04905 [Anaerolineales bacterium]|nr:hypothetical protein [Anaerolineales bacterium]
MLDPHLLEHKMGQKVTFFDKLALLGTAWMGKTAVFLQKRPFSQLYAALLPVLQ